MVIITIGDIISKREENFYVVLYIEHGELVGPFLTQGRSLQIFFQFQTCVVCKFVSRLDMHCIWEFCRRQLSAFSSNEAFCDISCLVGTQLGLTFEVRKEFLVDLAIHLCPPVTFGKMSLLRGETGETL